MIIVYPCDENYIGLVDKSAASVLKIHPDARIVVVSPKKIDTHFENVVIKLPEGLKHNENDRITDAAYLKLFLPQLPFDKVICLDGDTIVQRPLDELWSIPCAFINLCETYSQKHTEDLGVKKYGLTGMMVMNLKALRKADFTNECLNAALPDVKYFQHEETIINACFNEKLKFIDVKYNYCHNRDYGKKTIDENDAVILHICGKDKSLMNYEPYEEIKQVKNFIKGKKVAIVGNAKSIFDKKNGKEIDAHDLVIRFNRGFVTVPEAQGKRTDVLLLACELTLDEKASYKAFYSVNRSKNTKCGDLTINNTMRQRLKNIVSSQPSTGFMAIDLCRESGAKSIDLYGFDFEKTPTFYNPEGYKTMHDYNTEEKYVLKLADFGIVRIN